METAMLAGLLVHPIAAGVLVVIVATSVLLLSRLRATATIGYKRLAFGYLGVLVSCLIIAAASSYVPPDEALTKWHVPPERYWTALRSQFLTLSVVLVYVSLIGVSIVGAPIIFFLAHYGLANVPVILLASIVLSLIGTLVLVEWNQPSSASFSRDAPIIVGGHLLLALGFCVGAGLPWSPRKRHET